MSDFRLLERGYGDTILLIPGWATDHRIFGGLDLPFNYLVPEARLSLCPKEKFISALKERGLSRVSILGWSMGSFLASEIAFSCPDIIGDVIIFVSARKRCDKGAIGEARDRLKKNRRAFLYKFYSNFFCEDEKAASSWFRQNLLRSYIDGMGLGPLLEGLDYLSGAEFGSQRLDGLRTIFVHGKSDRIAPPEEARDIAAAIPLSRFIAMEKTGHAPFLNPDFKNIFKRDAA